MRACLSCSYLVVVVALLGTPAFSQLSTGSSTDGRIGVSVGSCSDATCAHRSIPHQSYTAELKTTHVQVLADGTTITTEGSEIRASDSQNRVLFSSTRTVPRGDQQTTVTNAHVDDPVEGTQTNWNSQSKVAHVIKLPSQDQRHGCWASQSGHMHLNYGAGHASLLNRGVGEGTGSASNAASIPHPTHSTPTTEDLGTTTIQGVEAHGHRFTTVIPAGQIGNDKQLVRVNENWTAPGLNFALRSTYEDPQSGKSTTEVVNLDLSEPPISTFQPPDDFKVEIEELHQVACPEPGSPWQ
jgi:hypothetical protein